MVEVAEASVLYGIPDARGEIGFIRSIYDGKLTWPPMAFH
jgi:hypothetical protein